ncbi:hypothetical protein POSPLADRAFT_1033543 [Postia placenta MAD-698-R-SB12]|uniref:Uncharacterized protein n=1 Tax=Postia placenta MAD-698-R-SB12 TaxID=670580 RepID=A0A1X6N370_9APHY|nr:hypothetical protein POSPLADRAFT_1033543 [Postia placenta MAD-698-R-SB12]OSX62916.1 hypothetical protein POSPLADRAFT_1033543 [Postia placenta MAD-698-R-SB12]
MSSNLTHLVVHLCEASSIDITCHAILMPRLQELYPAVRIHEAVVEQTVKQPANGHSNRRIKLKASDGLQEAFDKMCELERTLQGHGERIFNKYIIVWRANQPSVQKTASARPRIAEDIRNKDIFLSIISPMESVHLDKKIMDNCALMHADAPATWSPWPQNLSYCVQGFGKATYRGYVSHPDLPRLMEAANVELYETDPGDLRRVFRASRPQCAFTEPIRIQPQAHFMAPAYAPPPVAFAAPMYAAPQVNLALPANGQQWAIPGPQVPGAWPQQQQAQVQAQAQPLYNLSPGGAIMGQPLIPPPAPAPGPSRKRKQRDDSTEEMADSTDREAKRARVVARAFSNTGKGKAKARHTAVAETQQMTYAHSPAAIPVLSGAPLMQMHADPAGPSPNASARVAPPVMAADVGYSDLATGSGGSSQVPDYSPQPLVPTPSSTRGTSAAASTDVSTPPVVDAYTNVSLPDVIWAEPEAMMDNLHVASERPVDIDGAFNRYFERWACAGLVNDGMVGNDADLPSTQGFVEQLTTSVRVHPPVDLKQEINRIWYQPVTTTLDDDVAKWGDEGPIPQYVLLEEADVKRAGLERVRYDFPWQPVSDEADAEYIRLLRRVESECWLDHLWYQHNFDTSMVIYNGT